MKTAILTRTDSTLMADDLIRCLKSRSRKSKLILTALKSALVILSLLTAPLSARSAIPCSAAPEGLAAWWPGDGHTYDVIGNRFAVLQGAVGYDSGQVGQAFSFDGSQERVRILESTTTDLSRLPRWTLEAWVRPTSFTNSAYPTIYSEGNRIVTLGLNNGTGKLESWVNNDSARRLVSTNALKLNEWSHVALVYDGTRRFLYLNGGLTGSTNTPALTDDASGAAIGNVTQNNINSPFSGDIDEVSLYNRALTAVEIRNLATNTDGKCFNDATPSFALQPESRTAYLGENITLTGIAMSTPRPEYQWQFNGIPLPGETKYTLTLSPVAFNHAGNYTLVASNTAGSTTNEAAEVVVKFCTDTPAGLVAWWPGDGSGLDAMGQHHGDVFGGVSYPDGRAGQSFRFNGSDAYLAVPDHPALSPHVGVNGEMSVKAWVNLDQLPQPDAATGENRRAVLAKGDPARWEYALSVTTAGIPEFFLWSLSGSVYASVAGGRLETNGWHHLVATLKKGQFLRLYQDNTLVGETTNFAGVTGDGGAPLYLGRRGDSQFLSGRVDEAALFNRAIDTNEIATLYVGGSFGKCSGAPNPAPLFVVQPMSQIGYSLLDARLAALALGTPRPTYQWYRNNVTEWVAVPGATNATLVFGNLNASQEGWYRVSGSNIYGPTVSEAARIIVVCHDILCAQFGEDFEKGWNGWTTDGAIWQVGAPTSGPPADAQGNRAHSGTSVAATVLNGNYPGFTDSRLVSPPFTLPSAAENLRLAFWHWYLTEQCCDYGVVEIRVGNGAWQSLSESFIGTSAVWTRPVIDLNAFAGETVQIAFHFLANGPGVEAPGWYVDDIFLQRGNLRIAEVSEKSVNEQSLLTFPVLPLGTTPDSCVSFQLIDPPAGAAIDPVTGVFTWRPS